MRYSPVFPRGRETMKCLQEEMKWGTQLFVVLRTIAFLPICQWVTETTDSETADGGGLLDLLKLSQNLAQCPGRRAYVQ